jgi:hypothetical protein
MRDFVSWKSGDLILLCRGYPGNGTSPVYVNGFARILGPFYDDVASDWWRFKHNAEIRVVDGRLPRKQMVDVLGMAVFAAQFTRLILTRCIESPLYAKKFLDAPLTL